ncbi:MAG: CBS domain-containing protein [Thermoplasmata archaeon]
MAPTEAGLPSLTEIRRRRRSLGLSQGTLAHAAGVSQSLVAKIEHGRVEPSYRAALALFHALEERERSEHHAERTIGGLATSSVVRVAPTARVTDAAHLLRRHAISQLPVMEGEVVVGSITDRVVVNCLADPERAGRLHRLSVADVMEEPFPQLDRATPSRVAASLLRHVPAILVTERGRPAGILTQSDLFKSL